MPHTNARLQELLTVLGFLDDIAPSETRAFENRTGELIARSAARRPPSRKTYPTRQFRPARHSLLSGSRLSGGSP